jgi:hypothetical protein
MTYEPGQQVLVRGMLEHRFADGLAYVRFSDSDDHMHAIEAADVVGPAPATPDEGETREPGQPISDDWRRSYERLTMGKLARLYELAMKEHREARGALAAAEAERDATNALISSARISLDQVTAERDELAGIVHALEVELASIKEGRALSVEAADPEGGGGHE